jgi:hypothetical protein
VAGDLVASGEGDGGAVGAGAGHDDLGVGDGGLGGRGGREALGAGVGSEELPDGGGLAGAGRAEQQDAPVALRGGRQRQQLVAQCGGVEAPGRGERPSGAGRGPPLLLDRSGQDGLHPPDAEGAGRGHRVGEGHRVLEPPVDEPLAGPGPAVARPAVAHVREAGDGDDLAAPGAGRGDLLLPEAGQFGGAPEEGLVGRLAGADRDPAAPFGGVGAVVDVLVAVSDRPCRGLRHGQRPGDFGHFTSSGEMVSGCRGGR